MAMKREPTCKGFANLQLVASLSTSLERQEATVSSLVLARSMLHPTVSPFSATRTCHLVCQLRVRHFTPTTSPK